ncbi:MAG: GtrA family protein, partial [Bacteroidia bacterium]|nr:GtrA family protein [Bacteroidia bacterium]
VVYYGSSFLIESLSIAKALGFIVGSFYTFFLNKFWTWKDKRKTGITQLSKFFTIYGVSLFINVAVNELFLQIVPNFELFTQINNPLKESIFEITFQLDKLFAFVCATIASAIWNFFGQKYWVFRK